MKCGAAPTSPRRGQTLAILGTVNTSIGLVGSAFHRPADRSITRAGDTVLMFTGGTEARSRSDQEFGEDRLEDVFATLRAFCGDADQSDDVTVTVTRFGA